MECFIGEDNYCLVQVPHGVTNGYKAYGSQLAILANCATMPHDKNELIYIDPFDNDIPYVDMSFGFSYAQRDTDSPWWGDIKEDKNWIVRTGRSSTRL